MFDHYANFAKLKVTHSWYVVVMYATRHRRRHSYDQESGKHIVRAKTNCKKCRITRDRICTILDVSGCTSASCQRTASQLHTEEVPVLLFLPDWLRCGSGYGEEGHRVNIVMLLRCRSLPAAHVWCGVVFCWAVLIHINAYSTCTTGSFLRDSRWNEARHGVYTVNACPLL